MLKMDKRKLKINNEKFEKTQVQSTSINFKIQETFENS